jgi:L,D-peptidoglycan transpeptidase YkuD (ErfK/YbiS/YcfS/YnhG family)
MGRDRRRFLLSATAVVAAAVVALAGCGGVPGRPVAGGPTPTTGGATASTQAGAAAVPVVPVDPGATTTLAAPPTTTASGPTTTDRHPVTTAQTTTSPASTPGAATTGPGTTAPSCPAALPGQLADTGGGSQLLTVVAAGTASTSATVTLWQRNGACWTQVAGPWTGRLGYNGLSVHHREGDGTTPSGLYAISSAFYGLGPDPGVHGSYHQLVCGDWWDEDPASAQYNTFQHLACGATPPFGGGSEQLWQQTTAYQNFAVVDYNTGPVVPGAGSAIFIHDDTGGATNGCVSLPAAALDNVLRALQPGQSPHIAIGTTNTIDQY